MSEWQELTWGNIATLEYGKALRDYKEADGKVPVFGTNGPVGWTDKPLRNEPGVIVGRKGAYRGIHFSDEPFFVIDTAFYLKPARPLNIRWAYYQLLTQDINGMDSGSAIPSTSRDEFYQLPVSVPPIAEQDKIAAILSSLDGKIALNRELNETLEGMARALFQSWFVDFDPVKAKLAAKRHGRDPEHACMAALSGKLRIPPGKPRAERLVDQLPTADKLDAAITALDTLTETQRQQLTQTATHFPDDFQSRELGLIPAGWEVSEIGEEVSIYGGATPSTKVQEYWDGENPWATPKDLSGLPSKVLVSTERRITDAGVRKISSGQLPKGTVLMSSRAPVGYLALATTPISINQGFIAMVCDKKLPSNYVLYWADFTMDEIKAKASGSTFAEISKKSFRPIACIVPDERTLADFHRTVGSFYEQIISNEHQFRTLAELRDTLLPKLLSGELSVGAAEDAVEAVAP